MISYKETTQIITDQFPEIISEITAPECYGSVYLQLTRFANFTNTQIIQKNFLLVRKCFGMADLLYKHGDRILTNAIEKGYVYSLQLNNDQRLHRAVMLLLPDSLSRCYHNQIQTNFQ